MAAESSVISAKQSAKITALAAGVNKYQQAKGMARRRRIMAMAWRYRNENMHGESGS